MKRSYHTNLKILYSLNLLPDTVKSEIPSSTLAYWKGFNSATVFGIEDDLISEEKIKIIGTFLKSKKLLLAAKALFLVYQAYKDILWRFRNAGRFLKSKKKRL